MVCRILLLISFLLCLPGLTAAQLGGLTSLDGFGPQNQLVVSPTTPEPGQTITVSLDDYAGGLFGAAITWRYGGEVLLNTQNKRSVEIVAGALGQTSQVEASLTLPDGSTEIITADITPIYIDVIIEPQTRIPNWFLGRAMPSLGSQVNATVVVSEDTVINPANHVYTWRVNQNVIEGGPLRGRSSISFETPRGDDFILSVSVSRGDGTTIATEAKRIPSVDPTLLFYEQHPLYGNQPFPISNSFNLISNTLTLHAEPFYLDSRVYNNPDVAEWEINNTNTTNGTTNPYEITLQRAAVFGNTNINFHVRSLQQVLQGTEDSVNISF